MTTTEQTTPSTRYSQRVSDSEERGGNEYPTTCNKLDRSVEEAGKERASANHRRQILFRSPIRRNNDDDDDDDEELTDPESTEDKADEDDCEFDRLILAFSRALNISDLCKRNRLEAQVDVNI